MAVRLSRLDRKKSRVRRHGRVRRRLRGVAERPRACVYRSIKHIYVQVIDDDKGAVLFGCSSRTPSVVPTLKGKKPRDASKEVGKLLASMAQERGIKKICFDRGGYLYHGRVKALAEGAREGGLEF